MTSKHKTTRKARKRRAGTGQGNVRAALEAHNLAALRRAGPALSDEEMRQLDAAIQEDAYGIERRASFAFLTRSGEYLLDEIAKDRRYAVAVATFFRANERYVAALDGLLGILKEAGKRMRIALASRPDMAAVLEEATAQESGDHARPKLRVVSGGRPS